MTLAVVFACIAAASGVYAWRIAAGERRRSAARVAALSAAIDPSGDDGRFSLFARESTGGLHPLLKVGAGFIVVAIAIAIVAVATSAKTSRHPAPAPLPPAAVALVEMNHFRQGDLFEIRGVVRNQSGDNVDGLLAEVTVLNASGSPIALQQAPIEAQTLKPGESSRFDVRLQGVRTVDRYRVSFVGPSGIVRHVDARDRVTRETAGTPRGEISPAANPSTRF
jgi:hypothetical protein